jgi:hypothetical protein
MGDVFGEMIEQGGAGASAGYSRDPGLYDY